MRISMEGASGIGEGAWTVKLNVQDTRVFGEAAYRHGSWSVIVLDEDPAFDLRSRELSFNPDSAKLLNIGTDDRALVLGPARATGGRPGQSANAILAPTLPAARGDRLFLGELTDATRSLGERLLTELRKLIPGELSKTASGKFVETPDNFWTVKIQPVDKSLSITVRGKVIDFNVPRSLQLSSDRGIYYSRFKINRTEQIGDALGILLQADQLRKRKNARAR